MAHGKGHSSRPSVRFKGPFLSPLTKGKLAPTGVRKEKFTGHSKEKKSKIDELEVGFDPIFLHLSSSLLQSG